MYNFWEKGPAAMLFILLVYLKYDGTLMRIDGILHKSRIKSYLEQQLNYLLFAKAFAILRWALMIEGRRDGQTLQHRH